MDALEPVDIELLMADQVNRATPSSVVLSLILQLLGGLHQASLPITGIVIFVTASCHGTCPNRIRSRSH